MFNSYLKKKIYLKYSHANIFILINYSSLFPNSQNWDLYNLNWPFEHHTKVHSREIFPRHSIFQSARSKLNSEIFYLYLEYTGTSLYPLFPGQTSCYYKHHKPSHPCSKLEPSYAFFTLTFNTIQYSSPTDILLLWWTSYPPLDNALTQILNRKGIMQHKILNRSSKSIYQNTDGN